MPYIENDFPIEKIDEIAQREVSARKPVYHIHKWWARRVSSIFRAMILATFLDDNPMNYFYQKVSLKNSDGKPPIILDPFMGGGTTIVEGLRLGAKLIGVDINPVAWFVTKKEIESVDLEKVEGEFKKLKNRIGEKIKSYYKTRCPNGHEAEVMYVLWVKKIRCESCGRWLPLYNSFMIAKHSKDEATVICSHCGEIFATTINEKISCPSCRHELVTNARGKHYKCPYCGYPGDILRAVQKEQKTPQLEMFAIEYYCPKCEMRGYKKIDSFDRDLFEKAKKEFTEKKDELIGKFIPNQEIPDGFNTRQVKNFGYKFFYEMFNERQLLCLSMLLHEILSINDRKVREIFLVTFSDTTSANNLLCRYNLQAQKLEPLFSHHAYWPLLMPVENNVWGAKLGRGSFMKYFKKTKRALKYACNPYEIFMKQNERKKILIPNDRIIGRPAKDFTELFEDNDKNVLLKCQTSEDLSFIPNEHVDAIVTDPPYYDNVMYCELSDFFYVWLRLGLKEKYPDIFGEPLTRKDREILVNEEFGKDERFYIDCLKRVFQKCHAVLKENGLVAFTFHHKETKAWAAVLKALMESGFHINAAYPVHSDPRFRLHALGKAAIAYDSILVCKKRKRQKITKIPWAVFEAQLRERILHDIERILKKHPDFEVEDAYVVAIGRALQLYSENYGGIIKEGKTLAVEEALETIGDVVFDILLRKSLARVPDVDRVSRIYAAVFAGREDVSYDTINKITRHGGIETDIYEEERLFRKKKKVMQILDARKRRDLILRKMERGIPLMYIDAAHLLRTARTDRDKIKETTQAIIESGINKETLLGYLHFLAERTKDVEWRRVEKSLESTEIPTLEKYM